MPRISASTSFPRLAPTVFASALLACSVSACIGWPTGNDSGSSPSPDEGIAAGTLEVNVDRVGKSLTLRNTTEFEVGYMVIEKDMLVVALFPPCGQQCPILVQGARVTVPFTDIAGYTPQAREARVLWWTYRRNADGTRTAQGAVRTTNIML